MEPWCRSVGAAIAYRPDATNLPPSLSQLAVVTWNVHVGAGDLDALIQDLREGRLDGEPASHFILLLQEVFRRDGSIPRDPGPEAQAGGRIDTESEFGGRRSIDAVARRNGLSLLYVPSMRNGDEGAPPEDRGNAILSTLPLHDWEALELPMERQRRVAVAARADLRVGTGERLPMVFVSVHLDHRSRWRRAYRSMGAGRSDQAQILVDRFDGVEAVLVGGDLNTWFGGSNEGAVRLLRKAFPLPELRPDSRTVVAPGFLPDLLLDHLFFRLPDPFVTSYRVIRASYGSDHRPVVGRVRFPPADGDSRTGQGRPVSDE